MRQKQRNKELLLRVRGLRKQYAVERGPLHRGRGSMRAVDGVDLDVRNGETIGLVGESGSGKTTLGRCILRLIEPTAGSVHFRGEDLLALGPRQLRRRRRHLQMVFQDCGGSLNPRIRVGETLAEPLAVHDVVPKADRGGEVRRLLDAVGLPARAEERYPHELSGGERQRIGIARALASRPDFVVADEPVSALDASVQAGIINLLTRLRREMNLSLLFIAHDLAVVQHVSDRVGVLYLGKIVEMAKPTELFSEPLHPYTVALLSAVPVVDADSGRRRIVLSGEPPDPAAPPAGCAFHPRCPVARSRCRRQEPMPVTGPAGRLISCHFPGELGLPEKSTLHDGTF